jgi:hypothetical protein
MVKDGKSAGEKPKLPQVKAMKETKDLNYKSLIQKVSGDLVILGLKDTCKTTLMMHLSRELRTEQKNHVIIFETFPKWLHEFDIIPYMVIADSDVEPKENLPYLEPDKSYIQWSKDFQIINAQEVIKFLRDNKDVIFLIECEDMEKISAFMTFVIYQIYRKQYLRAKAECLEKVNEHYWFMVEESHNLLDSTVIAKKTFNKLRKIQNEFRNLKMHMICVALRLQDLSPKIRSKMSILLSRVSLDDYQLKVRNLLRNSEFRDTITQLEKGKFVFPELDMMLSTEPFKQNGKPYEVKPIIEPKPQPQKKKNIIERALNSLDILLNGVRVPQPKTTTNRNFSIQSTETENTEEELNRFDIENEENDLREIEEEFPEEW